MSNKPAPLLGDYFTQDELATELDVTTATLWNWDVRGIGPPITRIGKMPYYARPSVAEWLKSREERRAPARNSRGKRESVTA